MSKEVVLVFQDPPYCGINNANCARLAELAQENNLTIRMARYNSPEGKELIEKAHNHGFMKLPFYTDGKAFAHDLSAFVQKKEQQTEPTRERVAASKRTLKKVAAITGKKADEDDRQG